MKVVKIGLLIFTIIITLLLFIFSFIMYSDRGSFQGASSAFFFLACTSSFSIFFHIKTAAYYPLKHFDKTIVELSKKYWALHISYGAITFLLGTGMLLPSIKAGAIDLNLNGLITAIGLSVFGILTLIEIYRLNNFVIIYKRRLERQEEIDDIKGVTK